MDQWFRRQVRFTNGRLYRVYHPMFGRRAGRHKYKLNPFGAVSLALISCVPFSTSEGRFHAVSRPSNAGAGKNWRVETRIAAARTRTSRIEAAPRAIWPATAGARIHVSW